MAKKKKSLTRFILASLLSTSLLFIGVEFLLRETVTTIRSLDKKNWLEASPELLVKYTGTGRRLVPNASVIVKNHYLSKMDVLIETNEQGFRSGPIAETKSPDELRILALGDSITIGDYFPIDLVFTTLLESALQRSQRSKKVSVINAGVMDIGLKEEILILKEQGISIEPDIVILNFYQNDSRPSWGFSSETRHRGWLRRHSVAVEFIYNQLKLLQWIKEKGTDRFAWVESKESLDWKENKSDFKQLVSDARYDWGSAWEESSWQEILPLFEELKSLSEVHGFKVLIANFPVTFQVYSSVYDDTPQRYLEEISKKLGFAYIDLLPAFREAAQENDDLFYDQCHPTKEGYELVAQTIESALEQLLKKAE
jgi:lysophospholipase L1-like esterase